MAEWKDEDLNKFCKRLGIMPFSKKEFTNINNELNDNVFFNDIISIRDVTKYERCLHLIEEPLSLVKGMQYNVGVVLAKNNVEQKLSICLKSYHLENYDEAMFVNSMLRVILKHMNFDWIIENRMVTISFVGDLCTDNIVNLYAEICNKK